VKREDEEKTSKKPFRLDKLIAVITVIAIVVYSAYVYMDFTGYSLTDAIAQSAQTVGTKVTGIFASSADEEDGTAVDSVTKQTTVSESKASTTKETVKGTATVCIDAALGGTDAGASANGLVEKNVTLSMANALKSCLTECGVKVVLTRDTDKSVTNEARISVCDGANADLLVSLRLNSAQDTSVRGFEIWVNNKKPANSVAAAEKIAAGMSKISGMKSRGVKYGTVTDSEENYYVNSKSKCASVVIQLGFITNTNDAALLKNSESEVASCIAEGIVNYLNSKN
jgi:N-acetylmuramoyl-L-alanine amidase